MKIIISPIKVESVSELANEVKNIALIVQEVDDSGILEKYNSEKLSIKTKRNTRIFLIKEDKTKTLTEQMELFNDKKK